MTDVATSTTTTDCAPLRTTDCSSLASDAATLTSNVTTLKAESVLISTELKLPASATKPTTFSATTVMTVTQNRHVKKAKLLAEHRKNAENALIGVKVCFPATFNTLSYCLTSSNSLENIEPFGKIFPGLISSKARQREIIAYSKKDNWPNQSSCKTACLGRLSFELN